MSTTTFIIIAVVLAAAGLLKFWFFGEDVNRKQVPFPSQSMIPGPGDLPDYYLDPTLRDPNE